MDHHVYHNIFFNQLRLSIEEFFPIGDNVFQQDNNLKHTAWLNKRYLEPKLIPVVPWPAHYLDLNPIENFWFILDRKLHDCRTTNKDEMFKTFLDGWNALPIDLLTRFINSISLRCTEVIKSNRWLNKY